MDLPVQDPETHALLRATLPSRPNKGVPSFQETPSEQRIPHAIYNPPLEGKKQALAGKLNETLKPSVFFFLIRDKYQNKRKQDRIKISEFYK